MPGFDKRAKALQKKVRKLISLYGVVCKRVRTEYINENGDLIPEKVDFYKGRVAQHGPYREPGMVDIGGFTSMDGDYHSITFDDLADVIENDRIIVNGYQWVVQRWNPELFGEYVVAKMVAISREKQVAAS